MSPFLKPFLTALVLFIPFAYIVESHILPAQWIEDGAVIIFWLCILLAILTIWTWK